MTNLIVGLICLALGSWGIVGWWEEFGLVLRGLIPVVCLLAGLAAVGAGVKSKGASKPKNGENELDAMGEGETGGGMRKVA